MRRVLFCMLAVMLFLSRTAFAKTEEDILRDALRTGDIIRLHVIAAGDDDENQRIKLCVRDKVLLCWRDALSRQSSADDMMGYLEKNRSNLEIAAADAAREEGFQGNVSAQVGLFPFPDRWYGSVLVPAGDYKALKIVLGDGKGKNWWCVLFPSLCLSLSSSETPLPGDQAAKDTESSLPGDQAAKDAESPLPSDQTEKDSETSFSWWVQGIFRDWPLLTPV